MTDLFLKLVNMSITASWLVLAVVLLRLVLKKAPKALHCGLWALVAIRLICPFSLESSLSLVPQQAPISVQTLQPEPIEPSPRVEYTMVEYTTPAGDVHWSAPVMVVDHVDAPFSALLPQYLSAIWLAGMGLMLVYAAESWLRIRRRVAPSVHIGNQVWLCDHIDTPFILGIFQPRIYLPSGLNGRDADFVLAHEQSHLKRKDHWWKPLGFLLLSIYWFNPVLWAAYILLCRDIEMACDEKVVKELELDEKKAYSTVLLNCSLPRHMIAACPLAFGEVGVKNRVRKVLNYKKPAFWIVLISVILCIAAAVCLLTDPARRMHLYEIDDSRNYSDLFTDSKDVYLVREGEEFPVDYPENLLSVLDDLTVREQPLDRSREETRDKTNRIHLQGNTYLNFSHNFRQVWIDNGVKPTYTYKVLQPEAVRDIFEILCGERINITVTEATSRGMTAVYSPKKVYGSTGLLFQGNYWLERANGREWVKLEMLPEVGVGKINVTMDIENQAQHMLDWSAVYGTLSKGTYRIGVTFTFCDILDGQSLTHDLYGEFTVEDNRKVVPWFDEDYNSGLTYSRSKDVLEIPGTDIDLLFQKDWSDDQYQEQLLVRNGSNWEPVLSGESIRSVYLTDLTGDGIMEVCVALWVYDPIYNFHIAVYDAVENTIRTLESPGQLQYQLTCRNDTLIATMQKENLGGVLEMGTLALVPDSSADGYSLQIVPLDESFRELTESIVCIDVYTRKVVCLSSPEEVNTMASLLRDLWGKVEPVTAEELKPILADDFNWGFLLVNYELGAKKLFFDNSFRYVWLEDSDGGYRVNKSEALRSFVESITDGVRGKETSGEPFATMDTPWDWCAGLNIDAIATANMNVKLYTIGSTVSTTGGVLSRSTLEEVISALKRVPKTAFQNEQIRTQSDYLDLKQAVGQTGVCISLVDTVNNILVAVRTNGDRIELLTTDDLEKTEDRYWGYYLDSVKQWTIDSPELSALLETYFEDPPVITYTVGAEYEWQSPVEFTKGDFSLTLRLIEGWEYEEYSDWRSSGIRCRPAGVTEGWIYFSFWPKGYAPKEENRYISEYNYGSYGVVTSWPSDVQSPEGFSTYGHIWSYQKYVMNCGDYAIINEGADGWFLDYTDLISDMITLSSFQEAGSDS